jgi:hypothetical protein
MNRLAYFLILTLICITSLANAFFIPRGAPELVEFGFPEWSDQLGDIYVVNFKDPKYNLDMTDAEMLELTKEVRFYSTAHPNEHHVQQDPSKWWYRDHYCSCEGSFGIDFSQSSLSNERGVNGILLRYLTYGDHISAQYSARVTFGDGSSAHYDLRWDPFDSYWWYITSDLGIKSVHLGYNGEVTSEGNFRLEQVAIGGWIPVASVSETGSLGLVLTGLFGLFASRKLKSLSIR